MPAQTCKPGCDMRAPQWQKGSPCSTRHQVSGPRVPGHHLWAGIPVAGESRSVARQKRRSQAFPGKPGICIGDRIPRAIHPPRTIAASTRVCFSEYWHSKASPLTPDSETHDLREAGEVASGSANERYVLCRGPLVDILPGECSRHQVGKLVRGTGKHRAIHGGNFLGVIGVVARVAIVRQR